MLKGRGRFGGDELFNKSAFAMVPLKVYFRNFLRAVFIVAASSLRIGYSSRQLRIHLPDRFIAV
jgi:hypothetical protein